MASSNSNDVKEVPGSYGLPIVGAILDRFDYFVVEGRDAFFKNRMEKYKSTVFRVNMPPGPPLFPDPRVIILLDAKSFPVLFDMTKVEKKNVFTGVYMPSTDFTGGYRVLSYLDPSEENHAKLKGLCFHVLQSNASKWFPEFERATGELWPGLESELAHNQKAEFDTKNLQMSFNFLCRSVLGKDPAAPGRATLGTDGPSHVMKWIGLQLAPIASTGVLPKCLEELTIHAVPLPFLLVRGGYDKVYSFFWTYGTRALDAAEQHFGLKREEACHNLVFMICFNTLGGMFILFPSIIRHIAAAGKELHLDLAREVREAIKSNGGQLNMTTLETMELVRSTVYEILRMAPPVPFQYGRAKHDMVLESHDGRYKVKKGEMLGGYQPFATRDPKVFDKPDEFLPRRFMGEGEKLLKYVVWSNGPETNETTLNNKQCAGKNFVVLIARLLVSHLFVRYDSFDIDKANSSKVIFTALKRATF